MKHMALCLYILNIHSCHGNTTNHVPLVVHATEENMLILICPGWGFELRSLGQQRHATN